MYLLLEEKRFFSLKNIGLIPYMDLSRAHYEKYGVLKCEKDMSELDP